MFSNRLAAAAIGLALVAALSASASAAVLYDANVPRKFLPTDADPLYYNPGPDSGPNRTVFDDVPISIGATTNGTALVSRVSFDIERVANAPPVTITAYAAPLVPNNPSNGGPNNLSDWGDPGVPTQIGSITLVTNGSTTSRTTISFGDGVGTLFNTGVLNTSPATGVSNNGFGYFVLGLKFSTTTNSQGWTIADPGPVASNGVAANGNIDVLWDYGSQADFAEFTYNVDGQGQFIAGAQFFKVEGVVVPEPASAALLGAGSLLLVGGRRRRRSY